MANSEDTRECEAMRKMFVGGINRDTSEKTLSTYFDQFGVIVDHAIILDKKQVPRGFGFITYDASDAVENVFQNRPHIVDGKILDVKRAMPRELNTTTAHAKVSKLFVGGVGPDLTPDDLQAYIESRHPATVGSIEKIDLTNRNKDFGFIECSSNDFADRLTISEHSFTLKGRTMVIKKVDLKQAEVSFRLHLSQLANFSPKQGVRNPQFPKKLM